MKNRLLLMVATGIVLIILPFIFSNPYYLKILITFGIFAIFALSLNFIVGYIGEISFGHAAFLGLGAYFTSLMIYYFNISYWLSLIIALVLTGIVGAFIGMLSLRLQGVHFAIITLAFAEVFRLIILNLSEVTRGAMGLSVSAPNIPFTQISLSNSVLFYYLVFLVLVGVISLNKLLMSTPYGKAIIAVRESNHLASSIGINVGKYKIITFTISSVIAALAGALYAPYVGIITPELLSVHYTTEGLLMVIVGGKGFLFGPLIGAFIFTIIPEFFWMSPEMQLVVFGIILVLSILYMPKGIAFLIQKVSDKYLKLNVSLSKSRNRNEEV